MRRACRPCRSRSDRRRMPRARKSRAILGRRLPTAHERTVRKPLSARSSHQGATSRANGPAQGQSQESRREGSWPDAVEFPVEPGVADITKLEHRTRDLPASGMCDEVFVRIHSDHLRTPAGQVTRLISDRATQVQHTRAVQRRERFICVRPGPPAVLAAILGSEFHVAIGACLKRSPLPTQSSRTARSLRHQDVHFDASRLLQPRLDVEVVTHAAKCQV